MFSCVIVTFPCVVLGQVWYLIVSIPDFYLLLNYIYHEWASIKTVYICYPQCVDIQISIPAMSSTTASVSELTIIRVWLPVKEACIIWTNIWVSASSDCIRLTYPYCKLQTIPFAFLTIICALVWASILLTARNPNILAFAVITSKEVVPLFERSDVTSCSSFLPCFSFQIFLVIYTKNNTYLEYFQAYYSVWGTITKVA